MNKRITAAGRLSQSSLSQSAFSKGHSQSRSLYGNTRTNTPSSVEAPIILSNAGVGRSCRTPRHGRKACVAVRSRWIALGAERRYAR